MALPTFDAAKHDVGINGVGYMRAALTPIARADAVPATARVASGEGRYDTYQTESFYAQAEWGGGAGQARFVAPDQFLTGIGDGGWGGTFFPARKKIAAASTGGTASWYFERQGVLYGLTASAIEQIESATTAALTSGTPLCKPVVSAADNALWVTNESGTRKIRKWDGTTVSDVSISGVTPYLVARYGRFLWTFGTRSLSGTLAVDQSGVATNFGRPSTSTSATVAFGTTPPTADGLVLVIAQGIDGTTVPTFTISSDWDLVGTETLTDAVNGWAARVSMYFQEPRAHASSVTVTSDTAGYWGGLGVAIAGLYPGDSVDQVVTGSSTSAAASFSTDTTATLASSKEVVVQGWAVFDSSAIGTRSLSGYTIPSGANGGVSNFNGTKDVGLVFGYKTVAATTAQTGTLAVSATAEGAVGVLATFRGNNVSGTLVQTTIHYTSDDGASWVEAFQGDSAGIPVPKAAVAAQGYLWLTTTRGLYQLAADEHEFEDHQVKVIVGITGPHDEWAVPYDTASVGTWLATFEGLIYYNVGATLRQFAPGGTARQVWPSPDWATVSGEVQSVVGGEGGVYFGAAGYLWRYNGKGVMPIAAEPAADDFDFMQFFQGRLYFNDDPASYFDFKYPSSRPDVSYTAATNFTTGYMIASVLDFEKTSETKVIRQFEAQGFFTGGTNEATGGSISIDYAVGDGLLDPGKYGGGATSLTWTNVGKLLVTDNGIKRFSLGTPLTCKRLYTRATLTPGSTGYPVLTALIVNGRALMPAVYRFSLAVKVAAGLKDRAGNVMYETATDVNAALDALETLRRTGTYFTLNYLDDDGSTTDYTVTFDQKQEVVEGFKGSASMSATVTCNLLELP